MMQLTIIGFGNQARSWATNLRDSGFPVRVALRAGSPSWKEAEKENLKVIELGSEAFEASEVLALLIPDDQQGKFLETYGETLRPKTRLLYAHGFALTRFGLEKKFPKLQHILFAPKAIGTELRNQFVKKGKLGAVYSLECLQENVTETRNWIMDLSRALGINLGPYETSFLRETNADLYSEQGLLCSLIPYAASSMFHDLVKDGTEPELAYLECWHELKLIITAMVDKGPEGFFNLISPNALVGAEKGYERLITTEFRERLRSLHEEIKSGAFDEELLKTDVDEVRRKVRERWQKDELNLTFKRINS